MAHGTRDWLVPPRHAHRLYAAAAEPRELALIERGLHAEYMITAEPEPLLELLLDFLARRVGD